MLIKKMKRIQILLILFLLNYIYSKNLRFTSQFDFRKNILEFINYKLQTDNCIEEFVNLFERSSKDIQRKLSNVRIYEYDDFIYGNFTFEKVDYFVILEEILERGFFDLEYHQKYKQDIINRSYNLLSYSWSKINLIYHIRNKDLYLINIFQRSFESKFEIAFLIFKNIPIIIKKKKSRPLIILTLSINKDNPLKEYNIYLPIEVIDKSLKDKTNLKTFIDFFDLNIMKFYNDKFGIEDNFQFPDL